MKSIAILQSNYIPWKGYFDLIASVDEVVILDSVQYTKNDWRNRNRIRSPQGPQWLTIPIKTAGRFPQRIVDASIADPHWASRHWRSISQSYARAPGFRLRGAELEDTFRRAAAADRLSTINRLFIDLIYSWMDIATPITSSDRYPDHEDPVDRILAICRASGAERYVSGPSAACYLDPSRFAVAGIELKYFDYGDHPEPRLSVIDGALRA